MRLTSVSQLELAGARLWGYTVQAVPDLGRSLPVSFDQRRHVGAGDRPGSWMALAFTLSVPVSRDALAAAWDAVVARHGTLSSVFSPGLDGDVLLHAAVTAPGSWTLRTPTAGQALRDVLRDELDAACTPFSHPSHRLCVVDPEPDQQAAPTVVIAADHAHVDMWSLVLLAGELATGLQDLKAGNAPCTQLPSAAAFADHTSALAAMPPAPATVAARWHELLTAGGGQMPVFPLPLGDLSPMPEAVVEVRDVLDAEQTSALSAAARTVGVRPIALAISALVTATKDLSGEPLRAVFPVHSRHHERWRDAVGWFITNAVLEARDASPAACADAVTEAIQLGSWPLAPLLEPHGGMRVPPGMFAVSWLDTRRLPGLLGGVDELRYVSASIPTDGVMLWFMLNDAGLHLRCRYPATPQAREHVGRWLDHVERALRHAIEHDDAAH